MVAGSKIISADREVVSQPVFPALRSGGESRLVLTETPAAGRASDIEIQLLQRRVAELEAALPVEARKAKEAGKLEGEAAGAEKARTELGPVLDRLTRGITELATLRARIRRESESDLVKLSLCVARRILRRELTVDADAVLGLVKAALDKVQAKDLRRVRVHPDFQGAIRRHIEAAGLPPGTEIMADGSLQPGDVIVETRLGDLDASIESQLAEIGRGFADRLNR